MSFCNTKMEEALSFIEKTSSTLHDRLHNFQLLIFLFVFYIVCQRFSFNFCQSIWWHSNYHINVFISSLFIFTFAYSFHILYWSKYVFRVNDVWYIIIIKSMSIFFNVSIKGELKKHVWACCIIQHIIVLCLFHI